MDFQDILNQLKQKDYQNIYFLSGEEPYFIDVISDYIEDNILSEGEKAFNQLVLYGKEVDFKMVVDSARQYPMMSQRRVVIVKEAQEMKTLNNLMAYVESPNPQCTLVINYKFKKLNKRSNFYKALKKNATILETKKLYDNQVPAYISKSIKQEGLKIDPKAVSLLSEYLGNNLSNIHNEVSKLKLRIPKSETINAHMIEEHVGVSKDYNIFEFQSAIGKKEIEKCHRIANYFGANPKKNPVIAIINSLYAYFTKVWMTQSLFKLDDNSLANRIGIYSSYFVKEYRVAARNYPPQKIKEILQTLYKYDGFSKGIENRNPNERDILKELVFQILS